MQYITAAAKPNPPRIVDYFIVYFKTPERTYRLDTFDETHIGPWLAMMFGLFPYSLTFTDCVSVEHSRFQR